MSNKSKHYEKIPLDPHNEKDAIVLALMSKHERIDYEAFEALIRCGSVTRLCKLKRPRTIFFDEDTQMFCYFNPYNRMLRKCGVWTENVEN
jgi:hypothetical protein